MWTTNAVQTAGELENWGILDAAADEVLYVGDDAADEKRDRWGVLCFGLDDGRFRRCSALFGSSRTALAIVARTSETTRTPRPNASRNCSNRRVAHHVHPPSHDMTLGCIRPTAFGCTASVRLRREPLAARGRKLPRRSSPAQCQTLPYSKVLSCLGCGV